MILLRDDEWSGWSDREIAKRCRVSNRFVSTLRPEVSVNRSQIEPRKAQRGGTTYTMQTERINADRPRLERAEESPTDMVPWPTMPERVSREQEEPVAGSLALGVRLARR